VVVSPSPLPVIGSVASLSTVIPPLLVVAGIAATKGGGEVFPIPIATGGVSIPISGSVTVAPLTTSSFNVAGAYNSASPSLATGTSISLQVDSSGSLFVKPFRRSESVAQSTTIAASAAITTVLASGVASVFNDISKFFISVVPLAAGSAPIIFTATLSDGTNSYVFNLQANAAGTAILISNPSDSLNLDFQPPLPAKTAATAWTVTLSVNTVTVNIMVVAVVGKAS
jgi:hypothetical protein